MDRIYPISSTRQKFLLTGLGLALSPAIFAQTSPSGLTSGIPTAQPAYLPTQYGGSGGAALINSMDALNDQTKLKAGDQLSYRVVEEQEPTPTVLTVSETGEVTVPMLGLFPAAGKTCRQLAQQLKPLLEKDYFYKATVIVDIDTLSTRPLGKVYLTGQVKVQGAIDIPPNEVLTVSRAILLDGGLADFADRRRIRLLHTVDGKTTTTVVDMKEILDRGHSEKDPVVQPGDTINVPERLINF